MRNARRALVALPLAGALATACHSYVPPVERSVADGRPAHRPVDSVPVHGAWVEVVRRTGGERTSSAEGELLAIDTGHIWIRLGERVRAVPRGEVDGVWLGERWLEGIQIAGLWQWSRWPQGIPDQVAARARARAPQRR
jgi:hypothetical protein